MELLYANLVSTSRFSSIHAVPFCTKVYACEMDVSINTNFEFKLSSSVTVLAERLIIINAIVLI